MNENFQSASQPLPVPPQQTQPPNTNAVSGVFKVAFIVAALITAGLLGPGVLTISSADGWGGIAIALGLLLIWGFSVAALLFAAFLRSKLPSRVVSLIFGAALGAQAALLLLVVLLSVTNPNLTTLGNRLLPIAIYILATVPVLLFVRFTDRPKTQNTVADVSHLKNIGLISLASGLVLSLGASWVAYPDFHIDRLGPKSPELVEFEKCLARSAPGQYNSEGCLTPNDPHIIGFPPQTFGFPVHSSNIFGNPTNPSLYFFVIIPNWLLWSVAVYLLLSVGNWIKSRMSRHV